MAGSARPTGNSSRHNRRGGYYTENGRRRTEIIAEQSCMGRWLTYKP
jgi:hypothetical protein